MTKKLVGRRAILWSWVAFSVEIENVHGPSDYPFSGLFHRPESLIPLPTFLLEPAMQIFLRRLSVLLAITCCPAQAADLLTVGSDAPQLDVEHWVQDGNGKFEPVTEFTRGKVYVVEFWATWCGPCVQSMPHLAGLQKRYAKQGVQVVSVSDEDLDTVETFLDREIRGGGAGKDSPSPKTYRELTSAYCLTTDPDQSTYHDYMEAAAKGGIPTAFIVGKDSKIEWIGHPMEMDGPLEAVVNDTWDRPAYIEQLKRQEEVDKLLALADLKVRQDDFDGALAMLENVIKLQPDDLDPKLQKLLLLIRIERFDAANNFLKQLFESAQDVGSTDVLAWNIYKFAAQGYLPENELVKTAITSARAALVSADRKEQSSLLDTVGHLLFVDGQLDQAIEAETKAASLAGKENREFIQRFLDELTKAKQTENEQAEDKSDDRQ